MGCEKDILVSVIMSVYKESPDVLDQAIQSIVNQTYSNIEFIIVLDNPENRAALTLINSYKEAYRIVLVENETNIGLVNSLNRALGYCSGEYIARMDADDVSTLNRIELEMDLIKREGFDMVGTSIEIFTDIEKAGEIRKCPVSNKGVRRYIICDNCVKHPTWLVNRIVYKKLGGYRDIPTCEDYDFIVRAAMSGYKIGNCPEVGLRYRHNQSSISRSNSEKQYLGFRYLGKCYLKHYIPSEEEYKQYVESSDARKMLKHIHDYQQLKNNFLRNKKLSCAILKLIYNPVFYYELFCKVMYKFYC